MLPGILCIEIAAWQQNNAGNQAPYNGQKPAQDAPVDSGEH
jgi:hypothetical protein